MFIAQSSPKIVFVFLGRIPAPPFGCLKNRRLKFNFWNGFQKDEMHECCDGRAVAARDAHVYFIKKCTNYFLFFFELSLFNPILQPKGLNVFFFFFVNPLIKYAFGKIFVLFFFFCIHKNTISNKYRIRQNL